ncbi:hypothetical protein MMC17_002571 [Xylographa soralifera]|nr:hypothetical protein [Xylographa soralifera]
MKTSSYFSNEALFHDLDPTTDRLFEEKAHFLFDLDSRTSFVRLHAQLAFSHDPIWLGPHSGSNLDHVENAALKASNRIPIKLGCSVDRVPHKPTPQYSESPGLSYRKITKPGELCAALHTLDDEATQRLYICSIQQWHSYSRLRLTRELFEDMMSTFDVFHRFREFVLLFGNRSGENEIVPPQMRFRKLVEDINDPLNASCVGFECAYGLRYVELNNRMDTVEPWSIRQTVVYHKYSIQQQSSTWVFIAASKTAELRMDRYIKSVDTMVDSNPFEIHLIILDTALANWRPYVIYLTVKIMDMSNLVIVADVEGKEGGVPLEVNSCQQLKDLEDQIIDTLLILDSTHDTTVALTQKYEQHCVIPNDSPINLNESIDSIQLALQEKQKEIELLRRKVKALQKKVDGTISLLSSLLDLGTGIFLKDVAEEARMENITIRTLTEKGTHDAGAVKVLTIITLIYLPATVVSNFFSTQFVSNPLNNGSNSLMVASNAWLLGAITLPLTVITILIWWLWVRLQTKHFCK